MKKLLTSMAISATIVIAIFAINIVSESHVSAYDVIAQANDETVNEATEENFENYEYTAQPGDSYIQMARKAVQTYGIETDSQIGAAGVLFAETNLASAAGWPILNEGQTVQISKESVKEWFDRAGELTDSEKAAWNYYVPYVDFNTNRVGEAAN